MWSLSSAAESLVATAAVADGERDFVASTTRKNSLYISEFVVADDDYDDYYYDDEYDDGDGDFASDDDALFRYLASRISGRRC